MTKHYTVSEQLQEAFLQTDYSFIAGAHTIIMRLDETNADLLSFLQQEQINSWAYLTAWNPFSVVQSAGYNQEQQQLLLNRLKGYMVYKGEGKGRDGNWPGEESYFVAGISRTEAIALGRHFGQNAILVSGGNLEPELLLLFSQDPQK